MALPPARRRPAVAAGVLTVTVVLLAGCGSSPSPSPSGRGASGRAASSTAAPPMTATTGTPGSTLAPVPKSGPLTAGAPIAVPFSADRVTAAESPDGAVFVAPQDPANPAPVVAWVVDGDGPAAVAEHVPGGIAALAADSANFYAATYTNVYAYSRTSGNQDGQWSLPPVDRANASNQDLVALSAAGGSLFVSITRGNSVLVYRIVPTSPAAPRLLVTTLGAVVGADGSVYYESADHHLAVLRPGGATGTGPALAASPNGRGGGVQFVESVAGGVVWVSEPAGQGLDAQFSTYDAATLAPIASYGALVTSTVVDTAAGPLVLEGSAGAPSCGPGAAVQTSAACVARIDPRGTTSDPLGVGSAVVLLGPGPAVVASDTASGQFDLVRLS